MMKNILLAFLLVPLFFVACSNNTTNSNDRMELVPEPNKNLREQYEQQQDSMLQAESHAQEAVKPMALDSLWYYLTQQKETGGCIVGQQYRLLNKNLRDNDCVLLSRQEWQTFWQYSEAELTPFLIQQLADTTTTHIHTCPFDNATSGELAVYCLQKIHAKNWYDFEVFVAYKDREILSAEDNMQAWLQAILEDEKRREVLANYWQK